MRIKLHVWRQKNSQDAGGVKTYDVPDVSPDMSFLEMLDVLNNRLAENGDDPIAFDHDCREGICGSCSLMIDGFALPVSCICVALRMAMKSGLNPGEPRLSPL
jgi:succinate dehydrogenase / fumarate reductase, iron-sulfur subunit